MDHDLLDVTDAELLSRVEGLRGRERTLTAEVIAHLAEIGRRGLHLTEGFSSLFAYCQARLGYSEHECYARIEAARCAREYPAVLERLLDGSVTMSVVALLRPHLTAESHATELDEARGKTKREVEELVARLRPKPDVPPTIRRVATSTPAARVAPRPTPAPQPIAPARHRYSLTIDGEGKDLLKRAKELSPSDDETLLKRALELLVAELERRKNAATARPRRRGPRAGLTPRSGRGEAHRGDEGRRPVRVRCAGRPPMHGAALARVPPPRSVRSGRPHDGRQRRATMPRAQRP